MPPIEDQPPPIPQPGRAATWDLVIADYNEYVRTTIGAPNDTDRNVLDDMAARDALGAERYGVRLQAFNGRDHLVDAYQEALDLAVYLRNEMEERPTFALQAMYVTHLFNLYRLRSMIDERTPK